MLDQIKEYLSAINMPEQLVLRVVEIFHFYEKVCLEPIKGMFVSDRIDDEGARVFTSLWFISDNQMMEADEFVGNDKFDLAPYANKLTRIEFRKFDYDFAEANDKSRMSVRIEFEYEMIGDFAAVGRNCDYLRDFTLGYLIPKLKK